MVMTPSQMIDLGSPCPDFELPVPATGKTISRKDFTDKPLLVVFMCNHCPFVKHIAAQLAQIGRDYQEHIGMVGINSNDANAYPDDSPEKMVIEAQQQGYTFPYAYDQSQQVARQFNATCTPDLFVYDSAHRLVYRGQIDDSRPTRHGSGQYSHDDPCTGKDLRAALDAMLNGQPIPEQQQPSIGCNIKWRNS